MTRLLRGAFLAGLVGAAACGAGPVPPEPAGAQELLYVASQEDVTVAVIDMGKRELVTTVDLKELGFSPTAKAHHTAVEPDGSFWYVSLIADGKVLKFDRQNRLVGQVDFETPGMLSLDPTSNRLYVGRSMAAVNPPQRVGVIDRSAMTIEEVDVFFPRPHALAVDPVGGRFFTASLGQNSVAYASLGEEDVDLVEFPGAGGMEHMEHMQGMESMNHMLVQFAVSPDGSRMVAGGQMSGELLVFDVGADEPSVIHTTKVGGQPWHPSFTPDGRFVWIPNQSANTVTVVDATTWDVVDVISHPALVEPHGSAVSADGRTVFVSSRNVAGTYHPANGGEGRPGTVVAIDAVTHEVTAVIEVGRYAAGMSAPARSVR
jgi:DNA-binding beta-propeller fold protein YncE